MTTFVSGGDFALDAGSRVVRALLLPYNEMSRTNKSGNAPMMFTTGTVEIPRDATALSANRFHDKYDPVARATSIEETDRGIVAEFSVYETDSGDEFLNQVREGKLSKVSAEVRDIIRNGPKVITTKLTGASFVTEGAFESAAIFSIGDDVDQAEDDAPSIEDRVEALEADVAAIKEVIDQNTNETESEFGAMATVPNTAVDAATESKTETIDKEGLFSLIADYRKNPTREAAAALRHTEVADFALTDVVVSGTGSLGATTFQNQWLSQLWRGAVSVQRVIPNLGHADLTGLTVSGYTFDTPPTVTTWAGNKAAIGSPAIAVSTKTGVVQRFAAGYDIGREFQDFSQGQEVIADFISRLVASYATVSDQWVYTQLLAAATPKSVTVSSAGYGNTPTGMGLIVDGALQILGNGGNPSFALVSNDLYRTMAFTTSQNQLAFLSTSLGLTAGSIEGFSIAPHPNLATGTVLMGDSRAATVFELPGSPIRVDALNLAQGGVDSAVHGYAGFIANDPTNILALKAA